MLYFKCDGCGFFLFKKDLREACENACHCPKPRAAHVIRNQDGTFDLRCNGSSGRCTFKTLKKRPCDRDSPLPSPVSETASNSATGSPSQTASGSATGGSASGTAAQSNESQVSKKRKREDRGDDSSASSKMPPGDDASSASPQTAQKRKEQKRLQSSHPRKAKPSQPPVGPPPVMPQGRPTANIEGMGLTKKKKNSDFEV
eukprot:g37666.t1